MVKKEINLGEYLITVDYDNNGALEVIVYDELNEIIESITITNSN